MKLKTLNTTYLPELWITLAGTLKYALMNIPEGIKNKQKFQQRYINFSILNIVGPIILICYLNLTVDCTGQDLGGNDGGDKK